MKINPSIFRAYDIRGKYPKEINEEVAYKIGRAFVKFLGKKRLKIAVGRDNRPSSPVLFKYLTKGITEAGADVIDIGLSATPTFYFAVANFNFDGGVNITASHNPSGYNGFKLVGKKGIPIGEKTGLRKIQKIAKELPKKMPPAKKRGVIRKKKVLAQYLRFNLRSFNINRLKGLKIVADSANSVSGLMVAELFKKIPCKFYHLFKKLDGRFPNHPPDPLVKKNLKWLISEVKQKKADLGAAFDGDGDRIIFVTEKGKIVSGDLITALMADIILKQNLKEKILYDIRSSKIVEESIEKSGGIPIKFRIGHSFIKEKMRKKNIIFGGEFSGHYYLRSHFFSEAPLFVLLKILERISQSQKTISEIIKPYQKYFHSGEINFKVKDKEGILVKLEKRYKKGKILKIDGLKVEFKNWWFLIRPSHTEPVLRLVIEAETKDLMQKKKKELTTLIKRF